MYDDILVPTDGSTAAEEAITHAVDVASQYGARLHALYVVDVGPYVTMEAGSEMVLNALQEEGEQAVKQVESAADEAGVEVQTAVVTGTAFREIVDYVDSNDVDLVVMGTHGRKGIDRYLLGSVTERVVRSVDVPVMTVRQRSAES
ncbi:universal stress protein [Haloplanus sp. GCM10025708]|uniref:universal stress protein n=1 Tax=Haloferacaceae TaxID=1644056 RepID=UPI003612D862